MNIVIDNFLQVRNKLLWAFSNSSINLSVLSLQKLSEVVFILLITKLFFQNIVSLKEKEFQNRISIIKVIIIYSAHRFDY